MPGQINLLASDEKLKSRCVIRVRTTTWSDKRGLHQKKSLTFLRRQSKGFNLVESDLEAIGAEDVLHGILNFCDVEDGVYEVVLCNVSHDFETGYVERYDYKLIAV